MYRVEYSNVTEADVEYSACDRTGGGDSELTQTETMRGGKVGEEMSVRVQRL